MKDPLLTRLKETIAEIVAHHRKAPRMEDDTRLFEGGLGLDSFEAVQLISLVEDRFGVEFIEDDISEEHFRTPRAIADLLRRRGAR